MPEDLMIGAIYRERRERLIQCLNQPDTWGQWNWEHWQQSTIITAQRLWPEIGPELPDLRDHLGLDQKQFYDIFCAGAGTDSGGLLTEAISPQVVAGRLQGLFEHKRRRKTPC